MPPQDDDLDPDRTRVRAEARSVVRPARTMPTKLEDMSLNMATSLTGDADATRLAPRPPATPPVAAEPEKPQGSLAVALSAATAIVLVVALAVVVFVGQRRINELVGSLTARQTELGDERAARSKAEAEIASLKEQLSSTSASLKRREETLDRTERQAQKLKETGEKTKAELGQQVSDLQEKLSAAEEDLADTRKALADEQESGRQTVAQLQASLTETGRAKEVVERDRDARLREIATERRKASDLEAENRKLKDGQAREQAAVKKLLVDLTRSREEAEAESARRQALEAQLRENGITPRSAPPSRPPPIRQEQEDEGSVGERDLQ